MVTTWCPIVMGSADTLVGLAHDKFMDLGVQTYKLAVQNLDGLNDINLAPYEFNVSFDYADPQATFQRPEKPTIDMSQLAFRDPGVSIGEAPTFNPTHVSIEAPPEMDAEVPTLNFGPRPGSPTIPLPLEPADPAAIVMPVAPDYELPPVPTLQQLNLPDVPEIQLPEATFERPVWVDPPFQQDWHFTPEPYTKVLVDDIVNTLRPMIVGSDALPAYIEQALWERGRSRIELETERAVDSAFADFAARGFSEPQGQLSARVLELRQTGQNATAEVTRDVLIRKFELAYEQQRFAITQGAALEGSLISLHFEEQRYLLEAARFQFESALAVVNYQIQVFNTKMMGYQTDAQVFRDRIQAALTRVELYRAQLEGVKALGELNVQQVNLYEAQLQAVRSMAEFYRTQVETVKVQADINMQGIEKYKAQLQAYEQRWRAYVAEWQGYGAGVDAESKRVDIYKALVEANAKRVDAWAASSNMKVEMARLEQQSYAVSVSAWRTRLERLQAMLNAEVARLQATATSVRAQADLFQAEAQVETAASAAADRSFELGLRREQADVETQLKSAQMQIQQVEFLLSQIIEIQRAKAQISSQLAASTMSAVSYGASVSSSVGNSRSCSTNFSFTGEVIDA